MRPEIILLVFVIVLLISLSLLIRSHIIDSIIIKHSSKIASLQKLNKTIVFHKIEKNLILKKHYDNKSNFNKIEPGNLMSAHIRNNLNYFRNIINNIKENRENKILYDNEVIIILSKESEDDISKLKILKKEYFYREKKVLKRMIIKPIIDCKLSIYMFYSSAKGKVNLSKNYCFSFNDIFSSYESVSRAKLDKVTYKNLALVERGEISDYLRYDILKRDNFKCVICGASSDKGARLHVDHIIPISKGGKSIPSNLRTLCERCNIGKSDKLEEEILHEEQLENNDLMVCPQCGSKLILRNGKNGNFYGCSNYPKCKYTKNI